MVRKLEYSMNKRRLFSAVLLPLAILPTAIVAACSSNDKTSNDIKAQLNAEVTRLNGLISANNVTLINPQLTSQNIKDVKSDSNALLPLLNQEALALKTDTFDYKIMNLTGLPTRTFELRMGKHLNFNFKVISKADQKQSVLSATVNLNYELQSAPPTQPDKSKVVAFIAKVKTAKDNGSLKLKTTYQTMTEEQAKALLNDKAAADFMTKYFDGYPAATDGLTTTVKLVTIAGLQARATSQTTLELQLTITDPATTAHDDTEKMSFTFNLSKPDAVTFETLKASIKTGVDDSKFKPIDNFMLSSANEGALKVNPDLLLSDAYTNWNDFKKTLDPTNYQYKVTPDSLKVTATAGDSGKKDIEFTITITKANQQNETAVTDALKFTVTSAAAPTEV